MNQAVMTAITTEIGKALKVMPALAAPHRASDETITLRVAVRLNSRGSVIVPVEALAATLLPRLGATRESALTVLVEAITEALNNDRKADATLRDRMKDADAAFKMVNDRLLSTLPKSTRTGKTFWDGSVETIPAGVTAAQAAADFGRSAPADAPVDG
jgi:hypothetical protein